MRCRRWRWTRGWSRWLTTWPIGCGSTAASRRCYFDLFWRTIAFAIIGSLVCFAVVGMYRHWMRYSSQREYLKIAEGVVLAVLALVGYVAVVQPQLDLDRRPASCRSPVPSGVLVLFGLLIGRVPDRHALPRPLRLRAPAAAASAPRRDARSVLIVGAGDGGHLLLRELLKNPELGYRPVGFVDDDPRKQGMRDGPRCSARPTSSPRCSRTSSPTRC